MDTNQRRDASEIKTHEEILSIFQELDRLEKLVKNNLLPENEHADTDVMLQEMERAEPHIETIKEPRLKKPINIIQPHKQKQQSLLSLYERHKKEQTFGKRVKRIYFSKKEQPSDLVPSAETELKHDKETRDEVKIVKSTFTLHITDEGSLVGLDIKKPSPPKAVNGFFERRRHRMETSEQANEVPASGLKGKMKRVFSKIIPQRSKEVEISGGIGGKIKGIFKRRSKE